MATFKNLKDIESYLQRNVHQVLKGSMELERVLANKMSEMVVRVVYDMYEPQEYERRGMNDGLSDPRNGIISDVIIEGNGRVRVIFENIASGADTLIDDMLVDTIEEGLKENWMSPNSPYADARPFMEETANSIRQNPSEVIGAIKSGLKSAGFIVR